MCLSPCTWFPQCDCHASPLLVGKALALVRHTESCTDPVAQQCRQASRHTNTLLLPHFGVHGRVGVDARDEGAFDVCNEHDVRTVHAIVVYRLHEDHVALLRRILSSSHGPPGNDLHGYVWHRNLYDDRQIDRAAQAPPLRGEHLAVDRKLQSGYCQQLPVHVVLNLTRPAPSAAVAIPLGRQHRLIR
eukprot:scaffold99034_cov69-Phaeocystis_antarctica.AAC.3